MKLLMTTDTVGGVWTYAVELARSLAPRGVEVLLATMGAPVAAEQWRQAGGLANVRLVESAYKLEWMADPWDDVARAGEWLLEQAERFRPDVVHLNGYAHTALPWRAPVVVAAHSCVLSWWEAVKGEPAPASWDRYRHEVSGGLHAADLIVAPSRAMLAAVHRHYAPPSQGRVIYNGRDARRFRPRPQAGKESFVLCAGRLWDEAKNLSALERAAYDLDWPVHVAGDEASPDGAGVPAVRHTKPLGRLSAEAMAGWLSRAAVYALPARYEPFGLSALEAALSGCALVLGDIASLREVWGDAAVYVPPDDVAALREGLHDLICDPGRRTEMAGRAAERAGGYTSDRMAEAYMEAYHDLLGRQPVVPSGSPEEVTACAS